MGPIGLPEMIIIVVAVILLFGAKRIPEFAKSLGEGISEFKKAIMPKKDDGEGK